MMRLVKSVVRALHRYIPRLMRALGIVSVMLILQSCANFDAGDPSTLAGANNVADRGPVVRDSFAVKRLLQAARDAKQQGDLEAADRLFGEMLAKGARSTKSLNHYAVFLREQWRIDEAEAMYQRALATSPKDAATHWNIGILYELYRGDYAQALEHYQRYQQYAQEPDRRVAAWVADLQRRIAAGEGQS